jgi:hypothetical protein
MEPDKLASCKFYFPEGCENELSKAKIAFTELTINKDRIRKDGLCKITINELATFIISCFKIPLLQVPVLKFQTIKKISFHILSG